MATFCLIHSSVQGPAGWSLLADALHKRSHRSIVPDLGDVNPDSLALSYAKAVADAVRQEIPTANENLWLVAHSASGLFLPWVVDQIPELAVRGLVYLAAYVPTVGESLMGSLSADPGMFNPDWIGKDPMNDDVALEFLFHDCEPSLRRWALATRRLMIAHTAMAEVLPPNIDHKVRADYILCRDDRTLTPLWMKHAAQTRIGVEPFEVDGGHCPQVSRPEEVADILTSLPDRILLPSTPPKS